MERCHKIREKYTPVNMFMTEEEATLSALRELIENYGDGWAEFIKKYNTHLKNAGIVSSNEYTIKISDVDEEKRTWRMSLVKVEESVKPTSDGDMIRYDYNDGWRFKYKITGRDDVIYTRYFNVVHEFIIAVLEKYEKDVWPNSVANVLGSNHLPTHYIIAKDKLQYVANSISIYTTKCWVSLNDLKDRLTEYYGLVHRCCIVLGVSDTEENFDHSFDVLWIDSETGNTDAWYSTEPNKVHVDNHNHHRSKK